MKKLNILLLIFFIIGCSNHKHIEIKNYPKPTLDNLDRMEIKAYRYVDQNHSVNKEKIINSVNHLLNNNIYSKEKVYYYCTYITTLVDKKGINSNNDIYLLATYLKKNLKHNNNNLNNKILSLQKSITISKEQLINDFYESIK